MRLSRPAGLALGALLVLTACGDDGAAPAEPGESAPPFEAEETVAIPSLDAIDGAERVVVEGVGVDVPDGVQSTTTELSEEVAQLVLTSEGRDRADLVLTVTRQDGADDSQVFLNVQATQAQLSPDAVPEKTRIEAEWGDFAYAIGVRGEVDPGDGGRREFLYVVSRDEDRSRIIGVSVEAAEGAAVEDSLGFEMLRTVRVDEG